MASPLFVQLVDDRGQAIVDPLRVCFQLALHSDCTNVVGGRVRAPEDFAAIAVEGDGHGPATVARQALSLASDGGLRAEVPRKAQLTVERSEEAARPGTERRAAMTVSLYSPASPEFRTPAWRATLAPGETTLRVPAGSFVVSLGAGDAAPDLQRLAAQPGGKVRLRYRPRHGWSLLVRVRSAVDGRAVGSAAVRLSELRGFGQSGSTLSAMASGNDGLAFLVGLQANLASLSVQHAGYLPARLAGISAGSGTFAFRDVPLDVGGRVIAHLSTHGRPLADARCRIDAIDVAAPAAREASTTLWQGTSDPGGTCRSAQLPAGGYKLRVKLADGGLASRWVTVSEGQDDDEDLALLASRISGVVSRGHQPVAGYRVQAAKIPYGGPAGARMEDAGAAESDEAGSYSLTVWSPGTYSLALKTPAGAAVAGRRTVTVTGDDTQTVDFTLDSSAITGKVIDPEGRPAPGAWVGLIFSQGAVKTTTGDDGTFELDSQVEGAATVEAGKAGFGGADPVQVQMGPDAPIAPLTLTLKRKSTLHGTVLSAAGAPVAGALVTSVYATAAGVQPYGTAVSGGDGSFDLEIGDGAPRAFVSGPGCPLSLFDLTLTADSASTDGTTDAAAPNLLRCPAEPAVLALAFVDPAGRPVAHSSVILRAGGTIVPQRILAGHLQQLGLPADSDGSGQLVLAGLAPGDYDLFLGSASSEGAIAAGVQGGALGSVTLLPLRTTELQVTVAAQP